MPAYVRLGPGAAEAGPPPAGAAPPPPPPIPPPQRPFPSHVACRRRRAAVPRGRGGALAVESVRRRAPGARGVGAPAQAPSATEPSACRLVPTAASRPGTGEPPGGPGAPSARRMPPAAASAPGFGGVMRCPQRPPTARGGGERGGGCGTFGVQLRNVA